MTQNEVFSVRQLGRYPATRAIGQDARARLDDLLAERESVDLVIDFEGVDVMTISFADEFIGKFLSSHDFSAKGTTVTIAGLNSDNRYSILVCVERRNANVVALEDSGTPALIGDKILGDTYAEAVQLGSFKANDIAERMSLSAQNANNRLKKLAEAGAIRKRQATGSNRGGKEFVYEIGAGTPLNVDQLAHG